MEWRAIVLIIINPPTIVSVLGFSVITNQTQRGPKMVSSKKKRLTSGAVMYLGAKVIKTKGIVTHAIHIIGTIVKSSPFKRRFSVKKKQLMLLITYPS